MRVVICLMSIAANAFQSGPSNPPQFRTPASVTKVAVPTGGAVAPRLDPPKGYRSVQVPDYIADTYMRFASSETAHDFQIYGLESRVSVLENDREKYDRTDIDSLKETRTKALVYLAIGSTLLTVVWGVLAALIGYFLNTYLAPRFRKLWNALAAQAEYGHYPSSQAISIAASEDHDEGADKSGRSD